MSSHGIEDALVQVVFLTSSPNGHKTLCLSEISRWNLPVIMSAIYGIEQDCLKKTWNTGFLTLKGPIPES